MLRSPSSGAVLEGPVGVSARVQAFAYVWTWGHIVLRRANLGTTIWSLSACFATQATVGTTWEAAQAAQPCDGMCLVMAK